jgi:hypothetical protein
MGDTMSDTLKDPSYERRFVYQALKRLQFLRPLYYKILLRKRAHHSDTRTFDWDWRATNYNRIAVVNLLLGKMTDPWYLEIGCASNALFNSVPALHKVGVDPVSGGTERKTSDEFFKDNTKQFDVVFIDGLHTYAQARKDVINAIKCLKENGWIALHDMLPRDWTEHHIPIVTRDVWCGDVWKVAFELSQTEGVDFKILKIDYGVGVFKLLKKNVVLKDLTGQLRDKEFSYFYDNIKTLPLTDWKDAQQWLRS